MTGSRILVTGATGFLGGAVREAAAIVGVDVVATDRQAAEGVAALDVCSPERLDAVFADAAENGGVDAVVHLAAAGFKDQGLVAGANTQTALAVHVNVEGFVHVVEAAARHGAKRVVWASSTTIYGPASDYVSAPVAEDAPLRPQSAYGVTKTACEHLGPILATRHGLAIVSARLPMVYGPGRWYGGSQQALVDLVESLKTGRPSRVEAWSGDTDWIHVADAATVLMALTLVDEPRSAYHAVGHRGSLADLAQALIQQAGGRSSTQLRTATEGAPDIPALDDSALRRDTGFTPNYPSAIHGASTYLGDSDPLDEAEQSKASFHDRRIP